MGGPGRATVLAAAAFTAGLLLAPEHASASARLLIPGAFLALALVLTVARVPEQARAVSFLILWAALGWSIGVPKPEPVIPEGRVWFSGTVRVPIEHYEDRLRYRLTLRGWEAGEQGGPLAAGAVMYVPDTLLLTPGEDVRVIASADRIAGPRNPGDIDWRGYWANRDVRARLRAVKHVERLGVRRFFGGTTRAWVGSWRAGISELIERNLAPSTRPLARALLIGDRSQWSETLTDRFALSGLMHLFAISGLHVGLVLLIVYGALSWLGFGPRIIVLLALPLIWLLVPLTGANPPVVRASVIITVAVIGRALQRQVDAWHMLALAYLLLLFIHPRGLADPGFQLSFAGAAGSVFAAHVFAHLRQPVRKFGSSFRRWLHRRSRHTLLLFVISCAAWLATAPVVIAHFGRLPLLGPVLTLPALALVALALAAGWLMVLASFSPWLASVFGASMHAMLSLSDRLGRFAAGELPAFDHLPLSAAVVAGIVLAIAFARARRIAEAPLPGVVVTALAAGVVIIYGSLWLPDARVKAAVLDVGQGDAILLRSAREAVLIDAGPEFYDTAARQLRLLGIETLPLLLLSHGDADHCGAVPELVTEVTVERALIGPGTLRDSAGRRAVAALIANGAVVEYAVRGTRVTTPAGVFDCLHPPPDIDPGRFSDNDLSLVWLWTAGGATAVFPGDASTRAEQMMLARADPRAVDLVLAGHHGSASSTGSAWLDALRPRFAGVSCGRNNPHGHPGGEVVDRVKSTGATLLRTDRDGALLFVVGDSGLAILARDQWW